ncbi:MAG: EF-P beta-lysylation protein EpmB [Gammaproteobacteria bacterium]|nr:EF-P beta-lysylation protein EpmB [Gammaproteobacteria bacterium]
MIPRTEPSLHNIEWQKQQARAVREPEQLIRQLNLNPGLAKDAYLASSDFTLRVPQSFIDRMEAGNPDDPLLRQILPSPLETIEKLGFTQDPVGDQYARALPGLLHKYQGRVLIMVTGACGIHCRYCFRRHYPYQQEHIQEQRWQDILHYIRKDKSIKEVILSGGDPLSLNDKRLAQLLDDLQQIPHLNRLRIHSRQPVVLPDRITPALLQMLQANRLKVVLVIHANHANELDEHVRQALQQLQSHGVQLLNQSVLLKGINDRTRVLMALSERLVECGVLPYYLHQLDRVEGATHFEVSDADALKLLTELRENLPGYMVPKLVREQAGELAKLPVGL